MKIEKKEILHLQKTGSLVQGLCCVKGCRCWQEPYYKSGKIIDHRVLCSGHRRLARARYLGNVPANYVPSRNRDIYPGHPRCAVKGCEDYCSSLGVDAITCERRYSRWCNFHRLVLNRDKQKAIRFADLSLPMPPLETVLVEDIFVLCEVPGCGKEVCRQGSRKDGRIFFNKRCRRHRQLKRRGLPDDYKYRPPAAKGYKRENCVIAGCENLQANKGIVDGKVRYDQYCEKHRRGRFKAEKKGRVKADKTKCILCGWEGPCDKHRVIHRKAGGKYVPGNVIIVCPNCHRKIHRELIKPLGLPQD